MLGFELARFQSLEENALANDHIRDLLRLMLPVAKLYIAKQVRVLPSPVAVPVFLF